MPKEEKEKIENAESERDLELESLTEEEKEALALGYEILPKDDLLDKFYKKAINYVKKADNKFAEQYYQNCNGGENRFYQKNITETKFIDETWIKTLEGLVPNVDRIIRNPKHTIRYEEEIVVVEKAKKTDAASVRHLASHTGLIRDIDNKTGQVTPKKIMTRYAEEDLATYENRFIMTLIERLYLFVKARYDIIKDNVESYQHDHLYYISTFPLKDEEIEFKLDVDIKRDLDNPNINKHNIELLARAERLMILVTGFKGSVFMRDMKGAKKVQPPIMKTNVILKNADFRNAYTLWLFMDRYNSLAYDIHVRERPVRLSREFKGNLDRISAMSYAALVNNKKKRQEDFKKIETIEPIVRKSTKLVKTNPKDMVKRPDEIEIQDNAVNEYYLMLNKKVMNQKIIDIMKQRVSESVAAKKVVKESIAITNAMFQDFFDFEEEVDYFERFITSSDPKEVYESAKYKARIAKVIREAKEADLKGSIRLEKSLYKGMLKATNERLRTANIQKKKEEYQGVLKQLERETKAQQKEKARLHKLIQQLDGKLVDIETGKTNRQVELEELKAKQDEELAVIKAESRKRLTTELNEMKKKHAEKLKAELADFNQLLEEAKARRAVQIEADKEKARAALEKEKAKLKEKAAKVKAALKEKLAKEKAKEKERQKKVLDAVKKAKSITPTKKEEPAKDEEKLEDEPVLETPIEQEVQMDEMQPQEMVEDAPAEEAEQPQESFDEALSDEQE